MGRTWRNGHQIIEANNRNRVNVQRSGWCRLLDLLLVKDVIWIILEPLDAFPPFLEIGHQYEINEDNE